MGESMQFRAGAYVYIPHPISMKETFENIMHNMWYVVAQEVQVTVTRPVQEGKEAIKFPPIEMGTLQFSQMLSRMVSEELSSILTDDVTNETELELELEYIQAGETQKKSIKKVKEFVKKDHRLVETQRLRFKFVKMLEDCMRSMELRITDRQLRKEEEKKDMMRKKLIEANKHREKLLEELNKSSVKEEEAVKGLILDLAKQDLGVQNRDKTGQVEDALSIGNEW